LLGAAALPLRRAAALPSAKAALAVTFYISGLHTPPHPTTTTSPPFPCPAAGDEILRHLKAGAALKQKPAADTSLTGASASTSPAKAPSQSSASVAKQQRLGCMLLVEAVRFGHGDYVLGRLGRKGGELWEQLQRIVGGGKGGAAGALQCGRALGAVLAYLHKLRQQGQEQGAGGEGTGEGQIPGYDQVGIFVWRVEGGRGE
jgi:hypothetical protein